MSIAGKIVGRYIEEFNTATGQTLPCGAIYQSDGLIAHVRKHHANEVDNVDLVPEVILPPDYIGKNPNIPSSIELVKRVHANVMVCVKLDVVNNYFYVASVFEISEGKLNNRIASGRLVRAKKD